MDGNAGKEIVPLRHGLRLVRETDETQTRPKCDQAPGKCNDNSRATGSEVSSPPCAAMIRSTTARPSPAQLVLAWSARICQDRTGVWSGKMVSLRVDLGRRL